LKDWAFGRKKGLRKGKRYLTLVGGGEKEGESKPQEKKKKGGLAPVQKKRIPESRPFEKRGILE